jgi:hypothetical protein
MSPSSRIAEERVLAVRPSGDPVEVLAAVGSPHQVGPDEWACPVWLTGLHDRLPDVHGGSSLQALCLGATLLRSLMASFVEGGGRLLYPGTNDEFDLHACFSGVGSSQ